MNFLKTLGINTQNYGASTGTKWMNTDDKGLFDIYSPADGNLIANVYKCSDDDYQNVINTACFACYTIIAHSKNLKSMTPIA